MNNKNILEDYRVLIDKKQTYKKYIPVFEAVEKMLKNFINKWIPMEEYYFSELNIKEQCDIVIDTSN